MLKAYYDRTIIKCGKHAPGCLWKNGIKIEIDLMHQRIIKCCLHKDHSHNLLSKIWNDVVAELREEVGESFVGMQKKTAKTLVNDTRRKA